MGDGLKIILKFNEAFWPANLGSIVGPGPVPEFWTTASGGRSDNNNLLTAFVNGENAESLIALGDGMIPAILAQLDTFFGNGVATANYADHFIMNWADMPYIRGAYSYPKPGMAPETRGLLKVAVNNKIYFAGEAVHDGGHHGTVHGAMESALAAVTKILTTA
jgi:monoamine oxidase